MPRCRSGVAHDPVSPFDTGIRTRLLTSALAEDRSGCTGRVGPVCGDGTLASPEVCDDGNLLPGDGCKADCTEETCSESCSGLQTLAEDECLTNQSTATQICLDQNATCESACAGNTTCLQVCSAQKTTCMKIVDTAMNTCTRLWETDFNVCARRCNCIAGCTFFETNDCNSAKGLGDSVCSIADQSCHSACTILPLPQPCHDVCTSTYQSCDANTSAQYEQCLDEVPVVCESTCQ
ncbi:MAG: DUF4215 domain-containing protein [bacterium]|nr:DUF4215 domain-containing protein [bacterium]